MADPRPLRPWVVLDVGFEAHVQGLTSSCPAVGVIWMSFDTLLWFRYPRSPKCEPESRVQYSIIAGVPGPTHVCTPGALDDVAQVVDVPARAVDRDEGDRDDVGPRGIGGGWTED